jgi:MOSC domain-containing protein YiiM
MGASVVSVNVSRVRTITHGGKRTRTAIGKQPVRERVTVRALGCDGDAQADPRYHGGPDRAVYAYAEEDYAWWGERLGRALGPGLFGENITLRGIDVSGERWRIGSTVFAVTSPRTPCYKLAMVMDDPHFVKTFGQALRPGAYLRVVHEGEVGIGDTAEIIARPDHALTLAAMAQIVLYDHTRIPEALAVPDLPDYLREWAHKHHTT